MLINPYFTGFFKEYYTPVLVPHCPPETLTNPYFTDFPSSKLFKCATFKNSLKYIIKRKNIYYFCIKIKNRVVKYSLKTDNVEFAKYLRNLIANKLKGFLKMTPDDLRKSLMPEFNETSKKSSIGNMLNNTLNDKYSVSCYIMPYSLYFIKQSLS